MVINTPTKIFCGKDELEKLVNELKDDRVLFVTGKSKRILKTDIFADNLKYIYQKYIIPKSLEEYGINEEEYEKLIQNARNTVGVLFENDPITINDNLCLKIFNES